MLSVPARWASGAIAIAVLAGAAYLVRRGTPAAPVSGTYVDSALCANCHSSIWQTFKLTGMGR